MSQDSPPTGRRISFWRVMLALVFVGALTAGAFVKLGFWHPIATPSVQRLWVASYVDVTATPLFTFSAASIKTSPNMVLSFVVADHTDPCAPSWGGAYSPDAAAENVDLDRRVARLQQLGGVATVSFGGDANQELSTTCSDESKLAAAYLGVIERYHVSSIDMDVENGALTDVAAGQRRARAMRSVQNSLSAEGKKLTVWLTVPVAPTGLASDAQKAVSQMLAAKVDLAGVNVLTMDYGSSRTASMSMAGASVSALSATHDQLADLYARAGTKLSSDQVWGRLGATPMIGQNDIRQDVFTLGDTRALMSFATTMKIGRVSLWSLNRDQSCGPNYADVKLASDSCSGTTQQAKAFSAIVRKDFSNQKKLEPAPVAPVLPVIADDPATSPYEIWSLGGTYAEGERVVLHGNVFQAKWWSQGNVPDDPSVQAADTPWAIVGPVLSTDIPRVKIILPDGTYPEWSSTVVYTAGNRVQLNGVPFQAKWWNLATSPDGVGSRDNPGPWRVLSAAEVTDALTQAAATAAQ